MLCGEANMSLGYLIIAEQMFAKCLAHPNYKAQALKNLGNLTSLQDDLDRALQYYQQSLEVQTTWELAYQVGLILLNHCKDTQMALEHFCLSIDIA